jgi:hypothetical protein
LEAGFLPPATQGRKADIYRRCRASEKPGF